MDKSLKIAFEDADWRNITQFDNGVALVGSRKDNKYGIINTSGQYTVQPRFADIADGFVNGYAAVGQGENWWSLKWGYIDRNGVTVVPFVYEWEEQSYDHEGVSLLHSFSAPVVSGKAYIYQNEKFGVYDLNAKIAPQFIWGDLNYYQNGISLAARESGGSYMLIDDKGNALSDERWSFEATLCGENANILGYKQNGKWGTAVIRTLPTASWARDAVIRANELGLLPDKLDFNYTTNITRAEFCALAVPLYEKLKGEITALGNFTDTADIDVRKIGGLGVVVGPGDGTFNPQGEITRQEAALILQRLAAALGKPLPAVAPSFADYMNSWARDAVGAVEAGGIMQGVGNSNFGALRPYTREQSILTLLRMWDWMQG
jgi:hypothetical protein